MNAIVETTRAPVAAGRTHHPQVKLLLKREFWEHKGGFFWAPVVVGGISLLLTSWRSSSAKWSRASDCRHGKSSTATAASDQRPRPRPADLEDERRGDAAARRRAST